MCACSQKNVRTPKKVGFSVSLNELMNTFSDDVKSGTFLNVIGAKQVVCGHWQAVGKNVCSFSLTISQTSDISSTLTSQQFRLSGWETSPRVAGALSYISHNCKKKPQTTREIEATSWNIWLLNLVEITMRLTGRIQDPRLLIYRLSVTVNQWIINTVTGESWLVW